MVSTVLLEMMFFSMHPGFCCVTSFAMKIHMGIDMVQLSHSLVLYYSHTQILQAEVRASLCRNDAKREMVPDPNAPRFGHMAPCDSERRWNLEERMDPSRSLHPD